VLSEISVRAEGSRKPRPIVSAFASIEQEGFPITQAFDGNDATGWAAHQSGRVLNTNHSATFELEGSAAGAGTGGRQWSVRLRMQHGGAHTLGRFALSVGESARPSQSTMARREAALQSAYARWRNDPAKAVVWRTIRPATMTANQPRLELLPDDSVLASGDITKSDTYDLTLTNLPSGITAIRLEAMPDESLPAHGPGMTYYEGPKGDFFLGEFQLLSGGQPVKIARASQSYAKNNFGSLASARAATDGDPQTGWTCADRPGEAHQAVFVPAEPLTTDRLEIKMMFGRHYACSLGRFRLAVTTNTNGAEAVNVPDTILALLQKPDDRLSSAEQAQLRERFLLSAPELAAAAREIQDLRKPAVHLTTMVMRERPAGATRPTFLHRRGEFLQPTERVEPEVPHFLPALPPGAPRDRLALARWLVSPENPLTARVVVNRHWASFFGSGLVATENDFGFQGESPSHPELLDWLARRFIADGWSVKKLHHLIATSSTYRQSSRITPELRARDPRNRLLARGPRVRLEAEVIRDAALAAAGVLSTRMYGAPVRPPQPVGVTEVAYGSPRWDVSAGEDRYRRSIYTFQKRSAPFAMFNTFDAPSGETCIARREISNTPLQMLTLLNDVAFMEAARQLGALAHAQRQDGEGSDLDESRLRFVFRRVLTRVPTADEISRLKAFVRQQRARLQAGELKASELAGPATSIPAAGTAHSKPPASDDIERATWTVLARAVLNLDEGINKQ
jgi:hypothetical protein